jgi:Subtilase family
MPEAPKNLPVKLFNTREQDAFLTEGGGSNDLPSWAQTAAALEAKCEIFKESLAKTAQLLEDRAPEHEFIPAVIKVSIAPEAMAKSHRGAVAKVFNRKQENNFIGIAADLDFLVRIDNVSHLNSVLRNLDKPMANQVGFSAITEVESFRPLVDLSELGGELKIKLVNYQDPALNAEVEAVFERMLSRSEATFRRTQYAAGVTIFRATQPSPAALDAILSFEGLHSITPMPMFEVSTDGLDVGSLPEIKHPTDGKVYTTIGVLDSGIADIPHLAPWLDTRNFSAYPPEYVNPGHGTFVAGIIAYGDELEVTNWVGTDGCILLNATVFPNYKIGEDELISNITRAIRMYPDVKIWNLSGGGTTECTDYDFSDFAKAIDALQDEFDILICKSAGNCYNFLQGLPIGRIPTSADSLRALVIGSIAHAKGVNDIAMPEFPSPFSRIGYGPNKSIKPDVTHYGGNSGRLPGDKITSTGVKSFSTTGGVTAFAGTSFSTPRVSALVGGLVNKLAEDFDPLLAKAMVIHSAKYPQAVTLDQTDRMRQMGYGLPSSIDDILYNSPHEITLILRDNIEKGKYVDILDFPYPDNLVDENGLFYGEITVTLVTNPYLDGTQGPEYCQTDVSISMGTYEYVKERDTEVATIRNPIGRGNPQNVLLSSHYKAKYRKGLGGTAFSSERQLRDESSKYHPVKKYAINLDEMSDAHRMRALPNSRKWYLQLKGLVNYAAEQSLSNEELAQDFCLMITIRDPHRQHDVYSSVTRSLDAFNFPHSNIKLRNENRIDLRNTLGGEDDLQEV